MGITEFPDVSFADRAGLLAVGGDLEVSSLLLAYRSGIFPWPIAGEDLLLWFAPPKRAVLFFDEFHISRSLRKKLKKSELTFRIDSAFEMVIRSCARCRRPGQEGTWITQQMTEAYLALHEAGYCHSIESYRGDRCVGGLYGVSIGGMFAGESMFYHEPDASKLAFCWLIEYLKMRGASWIDCQQITPLMAHFGAREVERQVFAKLLEQAVREPVQLF